MTSHVAQVLALIILLLALPHFIRTSVEASRRSCNPRHHTNGKRCEKLHKFLQDVLRAKQDLIWIDQIADQMRSKHLQFINPSLQDKIDAMFLSSSKELRDPLETKNRNEIHERHKRNPRRSTSAAFAPRLKVETESRRREDTSPDKGDFNLQSHGYKNATVRELNFNSPISAKSATLLLTTKTTTNADPLERVLQSINVFPVESEPDRDDDAAKSDTESKVATNRKMTGPSGTLSTDSNGDEVHLRPGRSLKSVLLEADPVMKNFTKLLQYSNENERSELVRAVQGDLAQDIVNAILTEVKNKKTMSAASRLESQDSTKPFASIHIQHLYRRESNFDIDNEISEITKKLISFAHQLILDEVEKRTCVSLPPDMQEFLGWLLDANSNPENLIKNNRHITILDVQKDKLNNNNDYSNNDTITNLDEYHNKVDILRNLLYEYEGLSKKDRSKAESIHEYLLTRVEFLEACIEAIKSSSFPKEGLPHIHV